MRIFTTSKGVSAHADGLLGELPQGALVVGVGGRTDQEARPVVRADVFVAARCRAVPQQASVAARGSAGTRELLSADMCAVRALALAQRIAAWESCRRGPVGEDARVEVLQAGEAAQVEVGGEAAPGRAVRVLVLAILAAAATS